MLEDTLRKRPVIVRYDWWLNYAVEAVVAILFLVGIWCGRKSRFMWLCLAFVLPDIVIHFGLGFGLNEVYIMSCHWLFAVPIALGFAFRAASGRLLVSLRAVTALLAAWLFSYNLWLTVGFLLST